MNPYSAQPYLLNIYEWLFGHSTLDFLIDTILLASILYATYHFIAQPANYIVSSFLNFIRLNNIQLVTLEITPPANITKNVSSTQQLFSILQQSIRQDTPWHIYDFSDVVSFEVLSTKKGGVKYHIKAQLKDIVTIQQFLISYLPSGKYRVLGQDSSPEIKKYWSVLTLKQKRHYALPLQLEEYPTQHDPITYIINSINRLKRNDSIVIQMIATPHKSWQTDQLRNKLLSGKHVQLDHKIQYYLRKDPLVYALTLITAVSFGLLAGTYCLVFGLIISRLRTLWIMNPQKDPLPNPVLKKITEPLFRTDVRILISSDTSERIPIIAKDIKASYASLNVPGHQYLEIRRSTSIISRFRLWQFTLRLPSLLPMHSNIFSSIEISSMYHFPYGLNYIENVVTSLSKTLPAPISLKQEPKFDVIIGRNSYHSTLTPIGLTAEERERHVYLIGGTGNGKTTVLQYSIIQDIQNGKGVAIIDPHGDMAKKILEYIPEDRINDVIYLNPIDITHPIGINLLELPPNLSKEELLLEKDRLAESIVTIMRKVFSDDSSGGHRIEYVLRNAVHTALTVEGATLFTILRLLRNRVFRNTIVKSLESQYLKDFWNEEFGQAGGMQRVKMASGITAKIDRFRQSAPAARMLQQSKSSIDFEDIINSGKILICNFSKGQLGEDTSALFGTTVLAKLKMAAERRDSLDEKDRRPFYVYVDEFQNFATKPFVDMLSESRKYKLFLTMAEQSTSQQDRQLMEIILSNVGTLICFRTSSPADEKMLLPLFHPYVSEGEIAYLPSYNFYMRIPAVTPQQPFSGQTVLLDKSGSRERMQEVFDASIRNYAIESRL